MPADPLLVDTAAVRTLGRDYTEHAAELAAVVARLRAVPISATALGPVAAAFAAALTEAIADQADAVGALQGRLSAADTTASVTAAGYEAAAGRSAGLLPPV